MVFQNSRLSKHRCRQLALNRWPGSLRSRGVPLSLDYNAFSATFGRLNTRRSFLGARSLRSRGGPPRPGKGGSKAPLALWGGRAHNKRRGQGPLRSRGRECSMFNVQFSSGGVGGVAPLSGGRVGRSISSGEKFVVSEFGGRCGVPPYPRSRVEH
jgi:hypothetical protein